MRFYSARETSHSGVFAVRQMDRQSGESREVEVYIVCVELQGGRDRYYIKAGRVATDRDLPRFFAITSPSLAHRCGQGCGGHG
jgi:hypothetical protein